MTHPNPPAPDDAVKMALKALSVAYKALDGYIPAAFAKDDVAAAIATLSAHQAHQSPSCDGSEPVVWELMSGPTDQIGPYTNNKKVALNWRVNGFKVRALYAAPQPQRGGDE